MTARPLPVGHPQLPDASRIAMVWLAEVLREGFTGRIELECNNGSVRRIQRQQVFEPRNGSMVCRGGGVEISDSRPGA